VAAENIDNTVNGTGLFPTKVPGLSDAADIQAALRLYHYGSYAYDGANVNPANLVNPSIAKHLQNLVDADATHSAKTTDVHGIANTANLATKAYVDTAVTNGINGATSAYSDLAGNGIDWNSVDLRFDLYPALANTGTVITKTESFTLSAEDVGKTILLSTSTPNTLTLPKNSSVQIPVGYSVDIIQIGTALTTITEEDSSVFINSKSNVRSLDGQYSKGTLSKIGSDTWFFFGNLLNIVSPTPTPTPTPAPTPTPPPINAWYATGCCNGSPVYGSSNVSEANARDNVDAACVGDPTGPSNVVAQYGTSYPVVNCTPTPYTYSNTRTNLHNLCIL